MDEEIFHFDSPVALNALAEPWIKAYRANRYLRRLSNVELEERIADIASNMLTLADDGKYRPRFRVKPDGIYGPIRGLDYLRMATEAWHEHQLRGLPNSKLDSSRLQIPRRLADESWCRKPEWISGSRLSLDTYETPRMLFRFSRADWNAEFVKYGRVRFAPASTYNDAKLINAVRDDEVTIQRYDEHLEKEVAQGRDYYCLCLSSEYDYRLFVDFKIADGPRLVPSSCIAIKDPREFSRRVMNAVRRHNMARPDFQIDKTHGSPVIYFDPFFLARPEIAAEIYFCKHFRFAYQSEFRVVLTTRTVDHKFVPFFLDIGSMEDISDMVVPPDGAIA